MNESIYLQEIAIASDGGTKVAAGSDGNIYYIDHRIGTKTPGLVYDKYPSDKGANIIDGDFVLTDCMGNIKAFESKLTDKTSL